MSTTQFIGASVAAFGAGKTSQSRASEQPHAKQPNLYLSRSSIRNVGLHLAFAIRTATLKKPLWPLTCNIKTRGIKALDTLVLCNEFLFWDDIINLCMAIELCFFLIESWLWLHTFWGTLYVFANDYEFKLI